MIKTGPVFDRWEYKRSVDRFKLLFMEADSELRAIKNRLGVEE